MMPRGYRVPRWAFVDQVPFSRCLSSSVLRRFKGWITPRGSAARPCGRDSFTEGCTSQGEDTSIICVTAANRPLSRRSEISDARAG
jgi:hypothetical protein